MSDLRHRTQCIWCLHEIGYDPSVPGYRLTAWEDMKRHGLTCPKSPLVARIKELEAEVQMVRLASFRPSQGEDMPLFEGVEFESEEVDE